MIHFHDSDIKKALIEVAPQEKANIEAMKFGEILE
jgi:carbonic anhydrase